MNTMKLKELGKLLYERTDNKVYIEKILRSFESEDEIDQLINFIKKNPQAPMNDINYEWCRIQAPSYGIKM